MAPWRFVLAEDELTPGAVLRLDNKRKVLAHYLSFLEFGPRARKHTAAWLPIAFCRSSVIKTLKGGTSGLQKALLRHLLVGSDSFRIKGVVLPIGENRSPVFVFGTLGRTVTDELGEKNLWSTRGASSTLPCFSCKNVCCNGENTVLPYAASDYLVDVSCPYEERFDHNTTEELWQKCDILSVLASTMNQTNFAEAQRRLGMTYNPGGILWGQELRALVNPFEVNNVDAAHGLICNGMAQREISLLLIALSKVNIGFRRRANFYGSKLADLYRSWWPKLPEHPIWSFQRREGASFLGREGVRRPGLRDARLCARNTFLDRGPAWSHGCCPG